MTPASPHRSDHRHRRVVRRALLAVGIALVATVPALGAPPVDPHVVIAQPQTDSVVLEGYTPGVPLTVQVVRGGVVAASAVVTPIPDPHGGIADINSVAGGACWRGHTPDISPGDVVRVVQPGLVEDALVQNITVEKPADAAPDKVTVTGTAHSATGAPLAFGGIGVLLQSSGFQNRPFLRAPQPDGSVAPGPPGSGEWTATFPNLSPQDHTTALLATTVADWTIGGTDVTEVTFDPTATGGPQGACTSLALTEGVTNVTPPAFVFNSTSLTVDGVAAGNATSVSIAISDANPATADVVGSAVVQSTGGGKFWSIPVAGASITTLSDGILTITPTFNSGQPSARQGAGATITKNMVVPDTTPPTASIVSGPKPLGRDRVATFDLASTEPGTFQCKLDAAAFATCPDPTVLTALGEGAHTFTVRALDAAGNVSPDVAYTWKIDTTKPRATATISAGRRRAMARKGIVGASTVCNERCTLTLEAKLVIPGGTPGRARLLGTPLTVRAGGIGLPRVRLRAAQLAHVQRRLRAGFKVRVFLNITAVDQAGNRAIARVNTTLTQADLS